MNHQACDIKRALISVSDKTGVVEFSKSLVASGVDIISTGGTYKLLSESGIPVRAVEDVTAFPEMMEGRVKTLHPMLHGGILGLRDKHQAVAEAHGIEWIDLVVCNLYPFAQTIQNPNATFDDAVENIDIGGPSMIRAAAKNMGWVSVLVDPDDYADFASSLAEGGDVSFEQRKSYAIKAFQHTAFYDAMIGQHFATDFAPTELTLPLQKSFELRYGENPHQAAAVFTMANHQSPSILTAMQHQGKQLSYNNIADGDAAMTCVAEFEQPACVVVKHANPCGVAVADSIEVAFDNAFAADSKSAFGGIVALNRTLTKAVAEKIMTSFFEVIIAPEVEPEALALFAEKKNLRVLSAGTGFTPMPYRYRSVTGGVLVQAIDNQVLSSESLNVVTQRAPSDAQLLAMQFAWPVLKHIKSNGILIAGPDVTLAVGAGQVSRIDAVEIALSKLSNDVSLESAVLASDAFFPFRDSIDRLAEVGVQAIIQPGGAMRDEEVIAACDEHGIAMAFTGHRCFNH